MSVCSGGASVSACHGGVELSHRALWPSRESVGALPSEAFRCDARAKTLLVLRVAPGDSNAVRSPQQDGRCCAAWASVYYC